MYLYIGLMLQDVCILVLLLITGDKKLVVSKMLCQAQLLQRMVQRCPR